MAGRVGFMGKWLERRASLSLTVQYMAGTVGITVWLFYY